MPGPRPRGGALGGVRRRPPGFLRMVTTALLAAVLVSCASAPPAPGARVSRLLETVPLVDGHVDLVSRFVSPDGSSWNPVDSYDIGQRTKGQVDLPRLRAGRVGAAIFTIASLNEADREAGLREAAGLLRSLAKKYPDQLEIVTGSKAIMEAFHGGRIGALLGVEGGDQIAGSLDTLREAHRLGVRALTLTWEKTNDIGDSNADVARHGGLSAFGVDVVREMNRLGMLVDLSHAADETVSDALDVAAAPVFLSHSSVRALCPTPRNVPDDLLRRVAVNGGVVMVSFAPYHTSPGHMEWFQRGEKHWAGLKLALAGNPEDVKREMEKWDVENPEPRVTLKDVADHCDHVRRIAGSGHVGLGSDFDGMFSKVVGLEDASGFPALLEELATRGWSDEDLRGLAGGNFLRVLEAVEAAAGGAVAGPAVVWPPVP